MPIALGIGAAILIALAMSKRRSRPPNAATAPRVTPSIPEETTAAQAVRDGEGTAEDYETLASVAQRQGDQETAERLREHAASAPERSTLEQAREHEAEPAATPPAPAATPPAPAPAPAATPPAPAMPHGFNPGEASRLASAVATNIRTKRYSYSRRGLSAFQRSAGLTVDGLYGGKSAGALKFYGVSSPPRPLFKSHGSAAIVPYPSNLANAARAARS